MGVDSGRTSRAADSSRLVMGGSALRWRKARKWNCVFRVKNAAGIPGGEYQFRRFLVVG